MLWPLDLIQRLRSRERERERHRSLQRQRSRDRETRRTLSYEAPSFFMPSTDPTGIAVSSSGNNTNESPPESGDTSISQYRRQLGERLFPKVRALQPVS